jgi:hypothetical protein
MWRRQLSILSAIHMSGLSGTPIPLIDKMHVPNEVQPESKQSGRRSPNATARSIRIAKASLMTWVQYAEVPPDFDANGCNRLQLVS